MEMNNELLERARKVKSAEELMALAKENGMELSEESAAAYFEEMHKSGELSDDELDNVAGGGCHSKDGRLVVTIRYSCENFICKHCGRADSPNHKHWLEPISPGCDICKFCSWEKGLWLCNHPANMK